MHPLQELTETSAIAVTVQPVKRLLSEGVESSGRWAALANLLTYLGRVSFFLSLSDDAWFICFCFLLFIRNKLNALDIDKTLSGGGIKEILLGECGKLRLMESEVVLVANVFNTSRSVSKSLNNKNSS